jgi:hypothetical protein
LTFSNSQSAAIERFKGVETRAAATLFLEDKWVARVCASWEFVTRHITADPSKAPADPNACWAWLWSCVQINVVELAYITGGKDKVLQALAIARANRLIYPDGTINNFVLQILNPTLEQDEIIDKMKTVVEPKTTKKQVKKKRKTKKSDGVKAVTQSGPPKHGDTKPKDITKSIL